MSELSGNKGSSGPILITAAVEKELSHLVKALRALPVADFSRRPVWKGELPSGIVYLALTGIGKVNAAAVSTLLLEKLRPRLIVSTGCGGAYLGSDQSDGGLAVAIAEICGIEGDLPGAGWHTLELLGI